MTSNKAPITISTHNGSRVCVGHNLRNENSIGNSDIDPTRKHLNETLVFEPIQAAYERIFGEAVKLYNEKQKRPERQIQSYYEHIKNDSKKHPAYEMIIQVGDYLNIGNDNPTARAILKEFISNWQERNPNLELIGAYIHADEATLHAHIDYIPVATGYVRGMHIQNGLDKALRQQGFDGKTATLTSQILWEKRENAYLENLCVARGFDVIHPEREKIDEQKRVHQSVEEYKIEALAQEINETFNYNQDLILQNKQLESKIENLNKEIIDNEKEIEKQKKELKRIQGRILTEKQVDNFCKNPNKDLFGRVKQKQTLELEDYKSLLKTAKKVLDGNKRERQLDERERQINAKLSEIQEKIALKEKNLVYREESLAQREIEIGLKKREVDRGLYDNTDKRLKNVEKELTDLMELCEKVKYKDGTTVWDRYQTQKQLELERQEQDYDFGYSR